jgi:hypothetical protein
MDLSVVSQKPKVEQQNLYVMKKAMQSQAQILSMQQMQRLHLRISHFQEM